MFYLKKIIRKRSIPVILQISDVECGAACLTMILKYYGYNINISECREYCGEGRDGVTAHAIAKAARHFGLRVKSYSIQPADLKYITLPAIVHWNFNHFVVLEHWSLKKIVVVDPAVGRRNITVEEFNAAFTGVILMFEPGVRFSFQSSGKVLTGRDYLIDILHIPGIVRIFIQIIIVSLFLQLFGLGLPVFTKIFVDHVIPYRITNIMVVCGAGIIILGLSQMVVSYLRSLLFIYLQGRIDSKMMVGFFEHVLTLPFRFFQQRKSGDLLMRLGSNVMIREVLTNQTISIFLDGSFVLVYLIILLSHTPVFGLLVVGIGLLQALILLFTNGRIHDLMQRDLAASAESQSYLLESLKGIATLKASGAEDRALDAWSNRFYKHLNITLERSHFSAIVTTAMNTLNLLSPLVLLWFGAYLVLHGAMSLGTMLALQALAISFLTPLGTLVETGQQWQLVTAYLERIADVVETEGEQHFDTVQKAPELAGMIELKNVNFRYDRNSPLVLKKISFTVKPGQKIALVGRTGAGKSTLAMLLLGLYIPTSGRISYDGIPIQKMDYRTLRSQFGAVLQESFLFNASIKQNIAFNDPNIILEQVIAAAKLAVIHDDIMEMPMDYETIIAEGGGGLSGGQRQRLSIARALAHNPKILLLDEATSHLDIMTEALVDKNLNEYSCTRIVIAHRLSTIRNADMILVLDGGTIVEKGTHKELVAKRGQYAALIKNQLT